MPELPDIVDSAAFRSILALVAAGAVAVAGHSARALSGSGAIAATVVGTTLVGGGGWWTGLLTVLFFVSSSALSRLARERQPEIAAVKGEQRDAIQVLANGGVPALLALASTWAGDPSPWLLASAGAVAGASADTWATELGRTSARPPRMITTWRPAPSGSSGAISARGTTGALLGAGAIALLAAIGASLGWWLPDRQHPGLVFAVLTGAGFAGALLDSLLGATVQAQYWCPRCHSRTEQRVHRCGTTTSLRRGIPVVTNDVVNLMAIAGSAVLAWVLAG